MADGCIYQRDNKNSQKWVKILLQWRDYQHLEKFKLAINSNHPVKKTNVGGKFYADITIVSDIMAKDLSQYGCVERKTGKVQAPIFEDDTLTWGFIHGYIDGDGTVSISKNNRYYIGVVGNKEIIDDIYGFMSKFNVFGNIYEDKREYSFRLFTIKFERMEYLDFIFQNTYGRNIIYMDRKYDRVCRFYKERFDKSKKHFNQKLHNL